MGCGWTHSFNHALKQLEAVKAYGDRVDVHSWSYPTVSGIAASGPAAALGFGSDAASYFLDLIGMGGVGGQTMSGISLRY